MWVVGILRHGEFTPLPDSPPFREAWEARAWAREFLEHNPGIISSGADCMTWRLRKEQRGVVSWI
jgi:hypothetical protein